MDVAQARVSFKPAARLFQRINQSADDTFIRSITVAAMYTIFAGNRATAREESGHRNLVNILHPPIKPRLFLEYPRFRYAVSFNSFFQYNIIRVKQVKLSLRV